jgi:mannose-1-phosphate guanylyltransferase
MKAVLLVGGEGTRLRPLTLSLPKPLVPVMNLPYLEQFLFFLETFGVDEVILTACYLSNQIENFCQTSTSRVKLRYVVEANPLGTGGAVGNVASFLNETFLVFNGDVITNFNLERLIRFHHEKKGKMTLALVPVEDTSRFGVVDLRFDGRISAFVEKPPKNEAPSCFINAGMYVMEPDVLTRIPKGVKYSIERELFPELADDGVLLGLVQEDAYWMDIGTPEGYFQVHQDAFNGKITLKGSTEKKVLVGEGSHIDPSAVVGPGVVLGRNCRIEHGARVVESILWDNVVVGEKANLFHAIIGSNYVMAPRQNVQGKILCLEGEKSFF